MKKYIEPEFVKEIWREGFSLENDVFQLLNKYKWRTDPNIFFEEKDGKVKDYDLLALRKIQINSVNLYFVLPIECKYNSFRIVFYTRTQKAPPIPCMYAIGDNLKTVFNAQIIEEVFKSQKTFKKVMFPEEEVFGIQSFDVKNTLVKSKENKAGSSKTTVQHKQENTDKNVLKGLKNIAAATRFEIDRLNIGKFHNTAALFFPLLITNGELFKANLRSRKRVSKETIFRYRTGTTGYDELRRMNIAYIHVVHYASFETVLKYINKLIDIFDREMRKNVPIS